MGREPAVPVRSNPRASSSGQISSGSLGCQLAYLFFSSRDLPPVSQLVATNIYDLLTVVVIDPE